MMTYYKTTTLYMGFFIKRTLTYQVNLAKYLKLILVQIITYPGIQFLHTAKIRNKISKKIVYPSLQNLYGDRFLVVCLISNKKTDNEKITVILNNKLLIKLTTSKKKQLLFLLQ